MPLSQIEKIVGISSTPYFSTITLGFKDIHVRTLYTVHRLLDTVN